ncbi:MAG: hypothetical protein ACHQQQ_00520 [Bacteroidota bacterium]
MSKLFYSVLISLLCACSLSVAQDNAPAGKISGYMFGDFFYNFARDTSFATGKNTPTKTALTGPADMQGFQFRRIYITYDNDISNLFTSRFRLEADQSALTSGTSALAVKSGGKGKDTTITASQYGGKITVFVKDAYLKWKNVFSNSDLIFGIQPTTAYDISEGAWGYRSLEKTIMDLRGIIPSRDFGLALRGKITDDGMFNYWAMISNGDGNSPVSSKFHRYSLNIQVKPVDNWQIDLNGDYRAMANTNDITSTALPPATLSNGLLTGSIFVGYNLKDQYSFGVEAYNQTWANQYKYSDTTTTPHTPTQTGLTSMGISVWGTYNLQPDLAIVARYDYYDPNTNSWSKGDSRNYIIGGVSWKPDKNVSIIPNIQYESYEAPPTGTTPNASVTGRVTFYYIFL